MNALKKVMKSKSIEDAIRNLPDGFFNLVSFGLSLLFMLNPLFVLINTKLLPWFPDCRESINLSALSVGAAVLLLFFAKKLLFKQLPSVKDFIREHTAIVLFGAFALIMVISTAVNGFTELSVFGFFYRREGLCGYLSYIVYFLLLAINNSDRLKKAWIYIFVGTSAVLEIYTVAEFYAAGSYDRDFVFHQYNHYGYYLLMSLAVSAMLVITSKKLWQKLVFSASLFLGSLALIINDTFGCQLAAIAGLAAACAIYSVAKGKFKPVTLVPVLVFALAFGFAAASSQTLSNGILKNGSQIENDMGALTEGKENASYSTGVSRMILWENGIRYISEAPLIGTGADATAGRMMIDSDGDNDRCHCEYMNYAICYGIPAALIYVAAVFAVYLRGLKYRKKLTDVQLIGLCSAMFYLISAVIGNSMYYTAPFLFILLGMGYYGKSEEKTLK